MTRPLRVLHWEDGPGDADLVHRTLGAAGVSRDIVLVNDQAGFEAALAREPFDLVIADWPLPDAVQCLHIGATGDLLEARLEGLMPAVRLALQPTLLNLNGIVADMEALLVRLVGADVTIALDLGPELAFVKADRGQIEQIVMNLAANARDAMPDGGRLTIQTANVELDEHSATTHLPVTPGPYVALTVTDTGTGVTPPVQARLFEPFFNTRVRSEPGAGTSFTVYFPWADVWEMVAPAPPPVPGPLAGTGTVLVVEDAAGLREVARRLLQRHGYTVLVAANAEEALRLFEQTPSIDVLLTDVVMPGASGPELIEQLVALRPALKVIYMSGYTEDAIAHHGVFKPGVAFLQKPFTSDALRRKIREVLDR